MDIADEESVIEIRERDALALAQLILDIYNRKKQEGTLVDIEKAG